MLAAQAAKYEARLAAQDQIIADLQNRMLAQEQRHGVNSEGVGSTSTVEEVEEDFDDRPKIAAVWQTMFALTMFAAPMLTFASKFIWTMSNGKYFLLGQSGIPISLSAGLLLTVSDPSNTRLERPLKVSWVINYLAVVFALVVDVNTRGSASMGKKVRTNGAVGLSFPVCYFTLYSLILCRRKLGNLPRPALEDYVYNRVFFYGVGGLPPMVYVTAEAYKCFFDNWTENVWGSCSAMYMPQLPICLMFSLFLFARLISVPLSNTELTNDKIASFKGLHLRSKAQLFVFFIIALSNLILYTTMSEGLRTKFALYTHRLVICCVLFIISTELLGIAVSSTQQR